jgi:hypothetical protein
MTRNVLSTLAAAVVICVSVSTAFAGPVTIADFSGTETVISMAAAGAPDAGAFSYQGLNFSEASTGSGGPGWRNLVGAGYGFTDSAGISNISIDLGGSFQKVGLDVHVGNATYMTDFFDASHVLLGSVSSTLVGNFDFRFAGWESVGGIASLNIRELSGENGFVGGFDKVRFENASSQVPEPASLGLVLAGLMAAAALSRRRKSA